MTHASPPERPGRVGIVSIPLERAKELARVLGLDEPSNVILSARTSGAGRGLDLDLLIIDGDVHIGDERLADLMPCLHRSGGHAYRVQRLA